MRTNNFKDTLKTAVRVGGILLLGGVLAWGQQVVNLTAGPASKTMPDGTAVPMWGYTCGAAVSGSTATCAALTPAATGWSPVVITVPTGQGLTINLTNSLSFLNGNSVPTSLVIVGQLGGGLGNLAQRTTTPSPDHSNAQQTTWPVADPTTKGTPPNQGPRVQSFSTEVPAGATTALTWAALRPGTYLIESGTHPSIQGPMGLYGILVVTTAPGAAAGCAYPGATATAACAVPYDADVPLLLSEIDAVQNNAVNTAVNTAGFSETAVWSGQPGGCGVPTTHTCYPPAVNYSPLYYLFNGVAFDKSNASASLFPALPVAAPGTAGTLVRFVNAGLRMHVPSIVGSQTGASAVPGFSLIAEDGNPLPGVPRVQSGVFMAAGKTYDVMVNAPAAGAPALPVFDRQLSLSGNATARDAGMLAYIGINGAPLPAAPVLTAAVANPDTYNSVVAGQTLTVSDPAKGVIANDVNVSGVQVLGTVSGLTLNANGTFTYTGAPTSFTYCGNGAISGAACATVTLGAAPLEAGSGITVNNDSYTSTVATSLSIKPPGVLANDHDAAGYPLTVDTTTIAGSSCPVAVNADGSFNATGSAGAVCSFSYKAKNSQGTRSAGTATVTLNFPTPSNLQVSVLDGRDRTAITDYRWIIEEDRTFYINPNNTTTTTSGVPPTFGTNFHTSFMPVVAKGCVGTLACESGQTVFDPATGSHVNAVCDVGNGGCRPGSQQTPVDPSQVVLDPAKRYYISVLPGDAVDPGHAMGGAQIACTPVPPATTCTTFPAVTVLVEPQPLPTAKVSVFVFQDDFPLNGEHDAGGGIDQLSPNEPGLGQFNITLFDDAGGTGDSTGQMTYDMFNMPLSNSLAGTKDPSTGLDACPISRQATLDPANNITGVIPVCPKYESDGVTLSPLAGQAVVANMPPGRYGVVATPGADRIAKGEEWLQTNTLDGGKAHDSFLKVSEPGYFQEYGPAGYHVAIGFANPAIINARKAALAGTHTVTGLVTGVHMSRTPDQRLYGTGTRDTFSYTQCYASLGDPDGADFAFEKCADDGTFTFTGIPSGDWRVTIFDQWNDQIVDGISTPVRVTGNGTVNMGEIAVHAWKQNLYTRTFFDTNGDGVSQDAEPGLSLVPTNIRFRDGSFSNFNSTDLAGFAGFNEVFPLFNWYVVETDSNRYKNTGTHVVYDAGGPADGSPSCGQAGYPPCGPGSHVISNNLANTNEPASVALPSNLRVPGSVYCSNADCSGFSIASGPGGAGGSTGRIDPPWVTSYGWQGFAGQNAFLEFGKKPFAAGENGGIRGHVVYASTRPFDDPSLLLQLSWEPQVPHVTINLYQQGTAPDGSQSLKLVDTTQTSSWDDWAQGFRSDGVPNMNCPGQSTADLFYFTLYNQPNYLNPGTPLPNNSQFKCYDGLHNWVQLQPAPYDGTYAFPSVTARSPSTGKPAGTNCTICQPNTAAASTDWNYGLPMLPAGKYVVEVVVPPDYELVKEEDKNILLGDSYIAPVTQAQFNGLGSIYIMPDQAAVAASYNANNAQNSTTDLGAQPRHEGDTGSIETFWPCVGQARVVPDFLSLFPQVQQVSPFAGATRNLCDRKEVTLQDQMSALAKFYIFTSTHVAGHFTGIITDDFTSEFDPFSPSFGEKFAPAYLPVSVKDWAGNEVSRVYSDQWGQYDGLNYSTFGVNPPAPTGYVPQMMVLCMNDPGSAPIPDPLFQAGYSQFCYELPFMPGQTGYFDTPVIPTAAFSEGYNHPDCDYPDATPAISSVDGDGVGPWVSTSGPRTITIHALGDQPVNNYGYSGPSATAAPFNQKTVIRHYGFGPAPAGGCSNGNASAACPSVTVGGIPLHGVTWTDTTITGTVQSNVPLCPIQQRPPAPQDARCGELVIVATNGKHSIDSVTVTIGGKAPTRLAAGQTIQSAIDAAAAGDLIIVPPGSYNEILLMWKPVRLQGVGAASSIINANTHPAGEKLNPWRRQVVCLFGLALNGTPISGSNPYDGTDGFTCSTAMRGQVDRLPLEATVGWDATLNGNLAEQLQEPTLMGAYEGAAITVLSKGVRFPAGSNPFAADTFPDGTTLVTNSNADCSAYPSNFQCNPSRIDGLGITNSSQGGGGIYVHAWGHNLEIANNRIHNNQGTLSGGITVGQGEHPDGYLAGAANPAPGSCQLDNGLPANTQLPYCFDLNVNVHHNAVTLNSSEGDELFSASPSGAGAVSFCTGADNYRFNNNWICGNLSTGDGGGVSHMGFSYNGSIEHNAILFNQSTNPTTPTNGGGIIVISAPDTDPTCGTNPDQDCAPGMGDGTGPGMVIDANLIMGNAAESGSGGGLRLQGVNGTDVSTFPTDPSRWYSVRVTNNIIANNVAGWDGAGVSLTDSLVVNFINNTVVSNDATASSGVLFNTLFAPRASSDGCPTGQTPPCTINTSTNQPAGLVATPNSAGMTATLGPLTVTCPTGHPNCKSVSYPLLANDVFWQNRSFHIAVGALSPQYQQNVVTLVPTMNQTATGQCASNASYWDIGVRGDTGPGNHGSGFTLAPTFSVLTPGATGYSGTNLTSNPNVVAQYCNGSRTPPEFASGGYQVPPGTMEKNAPMPLFNLTAGATVDEGNNWINIKWGPLALTNPVTGVTLGNYAQTAGSPVNNAATATGAPTTDFFGNSRPQGSGFDIGAVELVVAAAPVASVTGGPLAFGNVAVGTTSASRQLVLHNTGNADLTGITLVFSSPRYSRPAGAAGGTCTGTLTPAAGTCTINVVFSPIAPVGAANGTLTITANVTVTGSPVTLTGTGVAAVVSATLTPATWTTTANRGVTTTGPAQVFILNNTGNVPLTGVTQASLSGPNAADFFIVRLLSTCGPAGGGQLAGQTTLTVAPGLTSACAITVQFRPLATDTAGPKTATLSVTDAAGTQTSALTGTVTYAPLTLAGTTTFGTVPVAGTTVSTQTFTVTNSGPVGAPPVPITVAFSTGDFTRPAAGGTCGATLARGTNCTIIVQFKPLGAVPPTARSATMTVPGATAVTLTGTAQ